MDLIGSNETVYYPGHNEQHAIHICIGSSGPPEPHEGNIERVQLDTVHIGFSVTEKEHL